MRNNAVVRGVRTLFAAGTATGLTDGQLLERYLRRGDDSAEAAFRALVERHGPMVLRACRGVLHDVHAAEDAFQATFLILARKAASIRQRDSVASWLFGVARRVAVRADGQRKRRAARERQGVEMSEAGARSSSARPPGTVAEVQEEVDRLPERYRAPVVLCYLEGLTQEEAAIRLRLPASTVRVRLMRARSRLRDRLIRRGLAPGALAGVSAGRAEAVIPAPLVEETVKAAVRIAVGRATGASAPVAALVEGVIRAMFLAKLKTAAVIVAALMCASLGMIATLAAQAPAAAGQDPPAAKGPGPEEKPKARPQDQRTEVAVATAKWSRWVRTTTRIGSVVSSGTVDVYPRISGYLGKVPVDIGSRVKRGDVLAMIDDLGLAVAVQKARAEVERGQARVQKAEAAIRIARAAAGVERARVEVAAADLDESERKAQYRRNQLARMKEMADKGAVARQVLDEEAESRELVRSGSRAARSQLSVARAAQVEAEARIPAAEADLAEARSELRVAEAGLKDAQILESSARIAAPFDGVVTRVNYHEGALVRPPDAGRGDPIVTVVREDMMLVVVDIPESDVPYLDPGDPATIRLQALGTAGMFRGTILRTGYALDPRNRTLRAEIALPNTDGRLRPGLDGRVEIQLEARDDVLTIPGAAIVSRNSDGSATCFRVADGRAVPFLIKVGRDDGQRAEVLEGLKEGDAVIVRWTGQISDGLPVTIGPE